MSGMGFGGMEGTIAREQLAWDWIAFWRSVGLARVRCGADRPVWTCSICGVTGDADFGDLGSREDCINDCGGLATVTL